MFLNLLANLRQDKLISGTRKTWQLNTGETMGLKAIYQRHHRSGLRYWTDLRKYTCVTLLQTSVVLVSKLDKRHLRWVPEVKGLGARRDPCECVHVGGWV